MLGASQSTGLAGQGNCHQSWGHFEWELNSIPDSIPGIGLGIGIEKERN